MKSEILELIDKAIFRNVVVYDSQAKPGLFSAKLVTFLNEASKHAGTGAIDKIYARDNSLKEYDPQSPDKDIKIYFMSDTEWDTIEEYFKYKDGVFAKNDDNLVLAVSVDNKSLIGTY